MKCVVCRDALPTGCDPRMRTCSKDCKTTLMSLMSMRPAGTKFCEFCGTEFSRMPDEGPARFKLRKACTKACKTKLCAKLRTRAMPPRQCVICGSMFERGSQEACTEFAARMTCGATCRSRWTAQQRGRADIVVATHRDCLQCGVIFERRSNETRFAFAKRRFCGKACGNAHRTMSIDATRVCVSCGAQLIPRPGEAPCNFMKRKNCDVSCQAQGPHSVLWFEFYGAVLSRHEIATLLGRSAATIFKRFPSTMAIARSVDRPCIDAKRLVIA